MITVFFSSGVQVGFYLWFKLTNNSLIKNHKHFFDYKSGVIGDGILLPLTNIFAVHIIQNSKWGHTDLWIWLLALICGYFTTYLFHQGQRYYKLTNWTMPEVGKWNILGGYHAIFMFFESSLLYYALIIYFKGASFNIANVNSSLIFGLFLLLLFFISFVNDYWKPLFKKLVNKYIRTEVDKLESDR